MKKSILSTILLSGLVLSVVSPVAYAAKADEAETDVEVYLEKDDGHEEGNGDYYRKLAIVYKPTLFKYKGRVATTGTIDMSNEHSLKERNFIAVNDDRRVDPQPGDDPADTDAGAPGEWKLSGKLNDIKHTYSSEELEAKLTVRPDTLYVYNIGPATKDANDVWSYEPKPIPDPHTGEVKVEDHAIFKTGYYDLKSSFSMSTGGDAVKFLSKEKKDAIVNQKERGVFTNLGDNDISILNGSGSEAGLYKGTITWTLEDSL